MKKFVVVMCMLAVTFFICSNAESAGAGIGKGSSEVGVQSSLSFTTMESEGYETKSTDTMFLANYGYFITDGLQVGGSLLTSGTSSEDISGTETSSVTTGFDVFAKYHFYSKGQTVVPYVGAQLGVVGVSMDSGDTTGSALSYGGMGGVKFFMSEKTSLNLELNYRHYDIEFDSVYGTYKSKIDNTALLIGFSVYF